MTDSSRLRRPQRRSKAEGLKVWGPLLAVAAIGFGIAIAKLEPPPPRTLKIAAGAQGGAYHAYAERYRTILARDGFDLEVIETAGSIENLQLLRTGEAALAIVQGGTRGHSEDTVDSDSPEPEKLESIASIFFEPVWVFYRNGLTVELLSDLAGRRIAVGPLGSGIRALATRLLADNGIDELNTELLPLSSMEAAAALESGAIDVAMFVSSTEAVYIEPLIANQEVELLSVNRSLAYRKNHPFLSAVLLGQGVLDIDRDLPRQDVTLVAAAASLVAHSDLHHALVPLLLGAMQEVHGRQDLLHPSHRFPAVDFVDFPLKAEAEHHLINGPSFLHRYLSFRVATIVDRLKILLLPLITLLLPVFKTAPPIYRWRIRSRIYRWYEDLRWADEILHRPATAEEITAHREAVRQIEREVAQVTVPLSYMDEYYNLRVHLQLILSKLEKRVPSDRPRNDLEAALADGDEGGTEV
ncbi:MAG: TAXI family TRAP transporter solute-binding subunit [Acidobacteriota bacterium]